MGRKDGALLEAFHEPVRRWFEASFDAPTPAQRMGWPPILAGRSTLLLAPTGSGKTLAAFLAGIDRVMFSPVPPARERCRLLYISPLKALTVDIERNLRAPIAGVAAAAESSGADCRIPLVAIRSGDTPGAERSAMRRRPPDILITTPESLFLILTSDSREILRPVETVILDEIHAILPSKRGSHLALSLERLEDLRSSSRSLQRIGLSATQRPHEQAARFLAGGRVHRGGWTARPVEIVDAAGPKAFEVRVEVPVEDFAAVGEGTRATPDAGGLPARSIWPSIHPRILELVRVHRSTMIFANSRRLAERLAAALNELAGEEVALAHHGSVAKEKRRQIEERLKAGRLPAIVATSSLELGIDMGAVDLVIQIEAPPSVASGLQRIGRAGHSVGAVSRGVIFPKYRGDLLASAAAVRLLVERRVEESRYPRNPLDVLAQQIVAEAAAGARGVEDVFRLCRRAAPFADLPRASFDGVLDMLAGRYPSDEFAELRPRIVWDRVRGRIRAREGAKRVAVANAGTIPDRGLYGVFLFGTRDGKSVRVGELDEEMVFESRIGDVFLLGASSWRIREITHDRVLVDPAPGAPGRMPFWHGDRPGRPLEFGREIGKLARELDAEDPAEAGRRLAGKHGLDDRACRNLIGYLAEQRGATGAVPSDRQIVLERYRDEMGDWRVCLLSPFGARVHSPWAMAVAGAIRREKKDAEIETLWSDDGVVFRFPESDDPPDARLFFPSAGDAESLVVRELGETSLFAAHFRESAARALLLPRRRPGRRSPLWHQRKRAADLLSVAARFPSFPIILETYRECLRDVFDLPGLREVLDGVASRRVKVATVDTRVPSPFASSLLFGYVSNFIYDADAPLAERRAQTLSIDFAQLRELLGEAELRELIDPAVLEETERRLAGLTTEGAAGGPDDLRDLLARVGDLSRDEILARTDPPGKASRWLAQLLEERRVLPIRLAGEERFIAVEDAARYRDGLRWVPPEETPLACLAPVSDALGDLVSRYARTHGPFRASEVAARLAAEEEEIVAALKRLEGRGRVVQGEFRPGGSGSEWCDVEVLRRVKQRSLAALRKQAEPVPPEALARFAVEWHGIGTNRHRGPDAVLDAVGPLQGAPLPASVLESEILSLRVPDCRPGDLDLLCAAGEVIWAGVEPLGARDGRIALYFAEEFPLLAPAPRPIESALAGRVEELLARRGASFFGEIRRELGGFPGDLLEALWELVWTVRATNDTLAPLRSRLAGGGRDRRPMRRLSAPRVPRAGPPGSEGRWSLLPPREPNAARRAMALASQLLERHGVITREAVHAEGVAGGFSAVYPILKAMEEAGKIRRGYFVEGLGATQFALPGAEEALRRVRQSGDPAPRLLPASDPANLYGAALPWPQDGRGRLERSAGALVVLAQGRLVGFFGRGHRDLEIPGGEASASLAAEALRARVEKDGITGVLIARINGAPASASPLAPIFRQQGFESSSRGLVYRSKVKAEGKR
jgi:ATP-dependent helicase Lhr and Lhr-like helicase